MRRNFTSVRKALGFTLIELLIVVAIIAILAAIAVPNFLEAQVRAKVARCASDMRSIATGLESYMVDYSVYPISNRQWCYSDDAQRDLTTPVAYLSSPPTDVFNKKDFWWNGQDNSYGSKFMIPRLYAYMSLKHDFIAYKDDLAIRTRPSQGYPLERDYKRWTGKDWSLSQGWQLRSLGPAMTDVSSIAYDSTNGTKSVGNISRFNTGIEY